MQFQSINQPTYCPTMSTNIAMRTLMTAIRVMCGGSVEVHAPDGGIFRVHALDKLAAETAAIFSWLNDVNDKERTTREITQEALKRVTVLAEDEEGKERALEQRLLFEYQVRLTCEVGNYFGMSTQKTTLTNDEWLRIILYALSPDACTPARKLLERMRQGRTLGIVHPVDKAHLERAREKEPEDTPEGMPLVWHLQVAPASTALAILKEHEDLLIQAIKGIRRVFFSLCHDDEGSLLMTDEEGNALSDEQLVALKTMISQHLLRVKLEQRREREEREQEDPESSSSSDDYDSSDSDADGNYQPSDDDETDEDDDEDDYGEADEGKRKRANGGVDRQGKRSKY